MADKTYLKATLAIFAISVLAQLTFAALPRYEITDLGTLGGGQSEAWSINNNGQIVGDSESSSGHRLATLFDPTGRGNNINLGTLGGYDSSACSINNNGQIVGWADKSQYFMRATLFDPTGSGNNTDLGAWPGSPAYPATSCAISINDAGQIVGWTSWTIGRPPLFKTFTRAALFDPSGAVPIRLLGTPIGGHDSVAFSINNSGQIVGRADTPGRPSYSRATLFDSTGNGSNIDLGTLDGYWSVAFSINNNGQIVGTAATSSGERHATQFDPTGTGQWHATQFVPPGTHQRHATLFDTSGNGNNIDLGTLGGDESYAISINESGQIVGWAYNSENDSRATLFDPTGSGNNIDLNTLIDPDSGWILQDARSINNHGWIVGKGYYIYNGVPPFSGPHAFLLIPQPIIIYVDDDSSGANDGSSWANAYNFLQDALTAAYSGDEIRVAQGTYKPDQGTNQTPGDREATFQLKNGVIIKGGYADEGQPDPNARDIELYETILTGDLAGNDVDVNDPADLLDEPTRSENSYHVVTGTGTDLMAVLDGFTITAGNDDQLDPDMGGPWGVGGGMYNRNGSPMLTNCTFGGNLANLAGGGMHNYNSSPTLTNCIFSGNSTEYYGGGMCNTTGPGNSFSSPTLSNCTFSMNLAGDGAGMYNNYSRPTLVNCKFVRNLASNGGKMSRGGGMYNFRKLQTLTNCIFIGNAADYGGGIYNSRNSPMLTNCTFSGNSAEDNGGAIYNKFNNPVLTNCILWGDTPNEVYDPEDWAIITYSNVQGGWLGEGNIDAAPLFIAPDYWDANGLWVDGDYHLLPGSPCIDSGDPNYIAEPNETDLDGRPRVIGGRIDMGAFESPIPAEVRIVPRTINLTSMGKWITCYIRLGEDYNVADIDPNSVLLEDEIQAELLRVDEQQQVAIAKFSRSDVQEILNVGEVELTITGQLKDGTIFEGTDTIKVIDKAGKK